MGRRMGSYTRLSISGLELLGMVMNVYIVTVIRRDEQDREEEFVVKEGETCRGCSGYSSVMRAGGLTRLMGVFV